VVRLPVVFAGKTFGLLIVGALFVEERADAGVVVAAELRIERRRDGDETD
jgi:hypothetical protein